MDEDLAFLALLVAGYALVAARLERLSVGPALVFLFIGVLMSEDVLGPVSLQPEAEPLKILAQVTLTLLLFADASTIRIGALREDAKPVSRLLAIGLLLTIALGSLAALLLFPGTSPGIALVIGAALAPTDAALGHAVVTDPKVPARVRRLLNVEGGLNDGIATPFVFLGVALAGAEMTGGEGWLLQAVADFVIGLTVGVLLGLAGGALLGSAERHGWTSRVSRQVFVLMLAIACYLVAAALGGNGFIAAFVGGLAFGRGTRHQAEETVRFTEAQGSLLAIGVWCAFGLVLSGKLLTSSWALTPLLYAVLSLTVIRMLPVALSLMGQRFQPLTILFIGWFGPRGLASIVFLVLGISGLEAAGVDPGPLPATVAWTVVLSVIVHGLTSGPFAARYGTRVASLPADAPELEDATEPRPARQWWSEAKGT